MEVLEGKMTSKEVANYLNQQADVLQKYIDAKLSPAISRQNPTARRMRIAGSMREEALEMERWQSILRALAKAHETNNILRFPHLEDIRNKKQIKSLLLLEKIEKYNWDLKRYIDLDQSTLERMSIFTPQDWKNAFEQLNNLLSEFSSGASANKPDREKETKIRQLEQEIISRKIPGFFPTPKELVERMIEQADIQEGDSILDPSAGKGDILGAVKERFENSVDLSAIEINSTLREILQLKGYDLLAYNFLDYSEKTFDKILMNPPFENSQDIDHIRHAYDLLNPGGRVVCLMSEGVFFRSYKKDQEFRKWLEDHNAEISEPIKDAFKNAFKSTGVAVRMVTLDKTGEKPVKQIKTSETDEMELLELEALAEIELLKMEQEKRKRKKQGLEGKETSKGKPYPDREESSFLIHDKKGKTAPMVKLSYQTESAMPKTKVKTSQHAVDFLRLIYDMETIEMQEHFFILLLNRANDIIGYYPLSKGGLTGTVVDLRLIFSAALNSLATSIILSHNHPSGNLQPSESDISLTRKTVEIGKILDVAVLDHIILTKDNFYSFADNGLIN